MEKDHFLKVANELINETESCPMYNKKQINKLRSLLQTDKHKFVIYFKRITGATDWDLPNIIYSKS